MSRGAINNVIFFAELLFGHDRLGIIKPSIDCSKQITLERARQFSLRNLQRFAIGLLKFGSPETFALPVEGVIED